MPADFVPDDVEAIEVVVRDGATWPIGKRFPGDRRFKCVRIDERGLQKPLRIAVYRRVPFKMNAVTQEIE